MTSKNRSLKKKVEASLLTIGDNIKDIDHEIIKVNELSDILNERKEDAKWSGDTDQLHKIKYSLVFNNHRRRLLWKRRKKITGETE